MSDGKWIIFEDFIIKKVDEISKKLESDIDEIKKKPYWKDERYTEDYPWECLLEEIKHIGIEHKRELVNSDYVMSMNCGTVNPDKVSIFEHQKKYYPEFKGIFDETHVEKSKRKVNEFMKSIE